MHRSLKKEPSGYAFGRWVEFQANDETPQWDDDPEDILANVLEEEGVRLKDLPGVSILLQGGETKPEDLAGQRPATLQRPKVDEVVDELYDFLYTQANQGLRQAFDVNMEELQRMKYVASDSLDLSPQNSDDFSADSYQYLPLG